MSKFIKKILRAAKPRATSRAKPRTPRRLGAASPLPPLPRFPVPRPPVPFGMSPRGRVRRWR
jgi:hypothetical protein